MTKDYYEEGRQEIERIFNSSFMSPQDLEEFAFGVKDWVDEYLGYKDPDEGIHTYVVGEDKIEPDPIATRVMLIQLADNLIREFSEDFPFEYMNEVGPAPLMYWFREGVPEGGMDWDWLALYCYDGIAEAYNYVRETWLPKLPALSWK